MFFICEFKFLIMRFGKVIRSNFVEVNELEKDRGSRGEEVV